MNKRGQIIKLLPTANLVHRHLLIPIALEAFVVRLGLPDSKGLLSKRLLRPNKQTIGSLR